MTFLSDKDIKKRFPNLFPESEQLEPERLQPSSYELRLGPQIFLSRKSELVDLKFTVCN